MKVWLLESPDEDDWIACRRRALVTVYGKGLGMISPF